MPGEETCGLDVPLPKVEEVPSMNTTGTSQEEEPVAPITGLEEAASSLALVNGHVPEKNEEEMVASVVPMKEQRDEAKDGHYFLRVAETTAQELRDRVEKIERDLCEHEFSDEGLFYTILLSSFKSTKSIYCIVHFAFYCAFWLTFINCIYRCLKKMAKKLAVISFTLI